MVWGGAGGIDFRSEESINLLNLADIVVTNPPFSLFREYVAQLIQYHKKFLILGNQNAVSYKDFLPRFIDKQVSLGYTAFRALLFDTPDTAYDGRKVSVGVCWFTNLSTPDKVGLNLTAFYGGNEDKYQKYDNISAINIERLADIPCDYYGLMGVPITFLGKYEPKQFDLIGSDIMLTYNRDRCTINGRRLYARIFIRRNLRNIAPNDNDNLTEIAV